MGKYRKPPRITRPKAPDADWNKEPLNYRDALAIVDDVKEKIDEAPGDVLERSFQFLDDVGQKVREVGNTIRHTKRVSEGQFKALEGWQAGINKCLKGNDGVES